jgi:hypothetical protein
MGETSRLRLGRDRRMRNGDHEFARDLHRQMALVAQPLIGDDAGVARPDAQPNGVGANSDHDFLASSNRAANLCGHLTIRKVQGWSVLNGELNTIAV